MSFKIVFLRHGESIWNKKGIFCGWTDVDLSEQGIEEARTAGYVLKEEGFTFDISYTSVLKRAIRTLWICLDEMNLMWIPVHRSWRLNERHYGALQGLNKVETTEKHGEDQVLIWRRSYDTPPPILEKTDYRYPGNDLKYHQLDPSNLPLTECLRDVVNRVLPYWHSVIAPCVKAGKRILVVAHGNSLRALVKYLDNIPNTEILNLNIPTGVPLVYELDENLTPISHYYIGDPEKIQKQIELVVNQGKVRK